MTDSSRSIQARPFHAQPDSAMSSHDVATALDAQELMLMMLFLRYLVFFLLLNVICLFCISTYFLDKFDIAGPFLFCLKLSQADCCHRQRQNSNDWCRTLRCSLVTLEYNIQ